MLSSSVPRGGGGVRVGRGGSARGGAGIMRGSSRPHALHTRDDDEDGPAASAASSSSSSSSLPPPSTAGTALTRNESTASDMSDSHQPHPDCLLCCSPIVSYAVATCQHSAQICGTCIMRVKLFIGKDKKKEEAPSPSAARSSPSPDLLNEENDFKPSAAALAEAELRAPMKCPYCHQEWSKLLITREYDVTSKDPRLAPPSTSSFGLSTDSRYNLRTWVYDARLNVYFENEATKAKYFMMTGLYCVLCFNLSDAFSHKSPPQRKYAAVHLFADQAQLEAHLEQKHQRFMCSACTTTRKIFIHEHQVFTKKELTHHFKYGSNSSIVTEYQPSGHQSGVIEPHNFCQFCEKPYFSNDELYAHLITVHRSCRFCASEGFHRYYRTDAALRTHFGQKHYLCDEGKCKRVEANHAAFRDVLALKAHRLAAHTEGLSKEEIRKMQTIDIDFFRRESGRRPTQASSGRHNRENDEFEFHIELPAGSIGSSSSSNNHAGHFHADDFSAAGAAEEFPSLGGGSSSASSNMTRSQSNPSFTSQSHNIGRSLASEEAFPSLGGISAAPIAAAASYRGVPPPREDFPTLRSVVKGEAKFARKQEDHASKAKAAAKKQPAPAAVTVDNRTVSSVPLSLPAQVNPADLPARNKALVAGVRAALRGDADAFELFKSASQAYRTGESTAASYLDAFHRLCANNPAGAVETEKLLMDLIATLQDDSQRVGLHGEYARRKVWNQVQSLKKNIKGGGIVSIEKNAFTPSPATSPTAATTSASAPTPAPTPAQPAAAPKKSAREIVAEMKAAAAAAAAAASPPPSKSPAPVEEAAPSTSATPKPTASPSPSPSPAPAVGDDFTAVESKLASKATKKAARHAANAQGIVAFEGRVAKPLQKDDGDDFLTIIAKEKEKEKEKEREAERLAEANSKKQEVKKGGWGESSAVAIVAPVARGPPGFGPPASSKMSRQNSWTALADEEDEPSQVSEPVQAARSRPAAKHTPTPARADDNDDDDPNPPLSSAAASSGVQLPEASALDLHLSTIEALRIPAPSKAKLQLLAMIFHELQHLIAHRHGDINAATNRRFQLSTEARAALTSLMRQTRVQHVWEFSRATRFGLTSSSVQVLSGLTGMHTRYGGEMVGDMVAQSLSGMTSHELFLLVEYVHHLLVQLTKPAHPDMKEMQLAFERDEERRKAQDLLFPSTRSVAAAAASAAQPGDTLRWQSTREDLFERPAIAATPGDDAPTQKKQKKGKQLLFKLG